MTFQNVRGLQARGGGYKDWGWRELVNEMEVDIVCMAEVNLDWRLVDPDHRFQRRIRDWWESSSATVAHNTNESLHCRQWGGCIVASIGETAHRVIGKQADPLNLGRWGSMALRGRGGRVARFVSVYRPVRPSSAGPLTTYAQHQRVLLAKGDTRDPRAAILEDLGQAIEGWHAEGETVIIGGDWNVEVTSASFQTWVAQHKLRNVLSSEHSSRPLPATVSPGSKAVDAILATVSLNVEACGMIPDDKGVDSDHSVLWVDIKGIELLGPITEVDVPKPRRLKPHDPRVRNRYLEIFTQEATEMKLFDRTYDVEAQSRTGMTPELAVRFEQILLDRERCMTTAEANCRKLRMGSIPWSPRLSFGRQKVRYWSLKLARCKGKRVKSKQLKRLLKSIGGCTDESTDKDVIRHHLDEAWEDYREICKRASDLRIDHLTRLAVAMADESNQKSENVLTQLRKREEIRSTYRRIKWITQSERRRGLTSVRIGTDDGSRTIDNRQEMEVACLEENARRFRQARSTPFLQEPLLSDFGAVGDTEAAEAVLTGTYVPPGDCDPFAVRLLQALKKDHNVPLVPDRISTTDFISMWKKAKDRTSSSPFSPHFGHWKSMAMRQDLADLNASVANICYTTGYVPSPWKKGVNVFLEKKPGVVDVDRLRIILLYDAEFNFTNKLTGRRLMANAERHSAVAPEQYGSRAGHCAIDHALNKRLTFDYWRVTRKTGVLCSNDAKSCYDRIVHSVAAMAMRRMGIGQAPVKVMLQTVQDLQHFVRTHYGDSNISKIPTSIEDLVHGIGQGNGSGPAIWVAISTPLLNIIRRDGFGATIQGAISQESLKMVGFAVVDDTDLIQESNIEQSMEAAIARMQESLNMWEGTLTASGGALVPEKSFWYLVSFRFAQGKWKYATDLECNKTITMRNAAGERVVVERCKPDEARRTLGVRLAPDGNNKAQVAHMKEVATAWGQRFISGKVRRTDAWIAMTTTVLKTLEYPLRATTMTEKECDEIIRPVLRAALPASGLIFTMPRVVLYGTPAAGGLGLRNLCTTQSVQHVCACMTHGHTNTLTGRLLRANVEAQKVEAGFPGDLFSMPYKFVQQYATDSWILQLWRFLDLHGMSIVESTSSLTGRCEEDECLMSAFYKREAVVSKWVNVNQCRMYLRASTISDIASGDGLFIPQWALQGKRRCETATHFPVQPRPPPSAWRDWRSALLSLCDGVGFRLRQPLGPWKCTTTHRFTVAIDRSYLWEKLRNGYRVYRLCPGRQNRRSLYSSTNEVVQGIPDDAKPAETDATQGCIRVLGARAYDNWCPPDPAQQTNVEISMIAEAWSEGPLVAVSDGSFKDKRGSAAWVFATQRGEPVLKGAALVPGSADDQSAYRSELYGLYRILCCISDLERSSPSQERRITVGCDGQSALYMSLETMSLPSPMKPHFDLLSSIYLLRQSIQCEIVPVHVKGHQDDLGGPLTLLETLNVQVDAEAKDELRQNLGVADNLRAGAWTLRQGSTVISGNIDSKIRSIIHDPALRQYWSQKLDFDPISIDWESLGRVLKGAPIPQRIWWAKRASGFEASGKVMHRRRQWESPFCVRCNRTIETSSHIGRCSSADARKEQQEVLQSFDESTEKIGSSRPMRQVWRSRLEQWQLNPAFPAMVQIPLSLTYVVAQQDQIGWESFMLGFISRHWRTAFSIEQSQRSTPRKPGRWTQNLIRRVWRIPWELWERRNRAVQETRAQAQHIVDMLDVNTRMVQLYNQGPETLHSSLHRFFQDPLSVLLHRPADYRISWVRTIESGGNTG